MRFVIFQHLSLLLWLLARYEMSPVLMCYQNEICDMTMLQKKVQTHLGALGAGACLYPISLSPKAVSVLVSPPSIEPFLYKY